MLNWIKKWFVRRPLRKYTLEELAERYFYFYLSLEYNDKDYLGEALFNWLSTSKEEVMAELVSRGDAKDSFDAAKILEEIGYSRMDKNPDSYPKLV